MTNPLQESFGFGDRLDEELTVAIREREVDLVVDLDVLQNVGLFDLEHHRHRFHVFRDVFVSDGDVVLAFADGAHFSACRVRLAWRAARGGTSTARRILCS